MLRTDTHDVHVLHVIPTLGVGGMELTLSRIANGLVSRGFMQSVICLTGQAQIGSLFRSDVRIFCLHATSNDVTLPWYLRRLIDRLKPTAIHARNWGAWPDVAIARLVARNPPPLVFSLHGLRTIDHMPLRQRIAYRVLARMTDHVMTVCEASRLALSRLTGLPLPRIGVISNGVDTAKFVPGFHRKTESGRMAIGATGSLTPVKDHALLVRACATLTRDGLDVELRIAGEGPERGRLVQLATAVGMGERLVLAGHVANMPAFLQGLDVFVLPSLSEAHPNALLEAMACGLACVGTRVGGVPDVLDGGRCGLLVDAGDVGSLAGGIEALAADMSLRCTLGAAARDRVCRLYSLDKMIQAYAALYAELTCRSR